MRLALTKDKKILDTFKLSLVKTFYLNIILVTQQGANELWVDDTLDDCNVQLSSLLKQDLIGHFWMEPCQGGRDAVVVPHEDGVKKGKARMDIATRVTEIHPRTITQVTPNGITSSPLY